MWRFILLAAGLFAMTGCTREKRVYVCGPGLYADTPEACPPCTSAAKMYVCPDGTTVGTVTACVDHGAKAK